MPGFDSTYTRARPAWHDLPTADTEVNATILNKWDQAIYELKTDTSHLDSAKPVYTGIITPAALTANQNNWSPTGLSTASLIRASGTAQRTITGLDATGVQDGQEKRISNVGSFSLVFTDQDAASSAANRFSFGAAIILPPGAGMILQYSTVTNTWRCMGISRNEGVVKQNGVKVVDSVITATFDSAATQDFDPTNAGAGREGVVGGVWVGEMIAQGSSVICACIVGCGFSTSGDGKKTLAFMSGPTNLAQPGAYFASATFTLQSNNTTTAVVRAAPSVVTGVSVFVEWRRMAAI